MDEIYRENILDHFKNPRNFGRISNPSFKAKEFNPVCGDEVEIFVKIRNGAVEGIKFTGKGCAISQASASMMTEYLKDKTFAQIKKMSKEDILKLLKIKLGVVRLKCALLPLKALRKGVENYG